MAHARRNLPQDALWVVSAGLREFRELGGVFDDVGQRGLAEVQRNVDELLGMLLREISDDCQGGRVSDAMLEENVR